MPEFPVHEYGTSEMMKWMLPALKAQGEAKTKWGLAKQKRQEEFLGKEIEAGTFRGAAPTGPRGPFPGGRFAQRTQAGRQAETLYGPGGAQRAQRMSLQAKAQINEDMENNKLTRKLKMVEGVNKQIDWTIKQVKEGGIDPTTHQSLINLGNENAQSLLDVNIGLTVADDAKAITQKWKTGAYKSLIQESLQAFEAGPTAGTHARLAMSIDKMFNLTGEKFEALKMSANKTMTDVRKQQATARKPMGIAKTPTPVSWKNAADYVRGRFGKQDPLGNFVVTPELANMHRMAQKKLVELKKIGKYGPLETVNMAEDFARNVERGYWILLEKNPKDQEKIKREYRNQYGYIPQIRSRM